MEEAEKKVAAKEEEMKSNEVELVAQAEKLEKAQAEVVQHAGELAMSCDTAAEVPTLRAQLEAAQDQARTTTALVVSEFLASEEMTKVKDSNYDPGFDMGMRAFTCTVATKHLNWDLSFLGSKLSALVDEWRDQWRAFLPQSDKPLRTPFGEPRVIPQPLEVHLE